MRLKFVFSAFIAVLAIYSKSSSQVASFPYSENFDGVTAPALPSGWSGNGFTTYASSPRSIPNCVSATGNRSVKTLISPVFNFGSRLPDKLIFYERRTSTAVPFRLEVRASLDNVNFSILLARFDTITTTTSYVQRIVDLSHSGLHSQPNVQFAWIILADSTNNTGVLRMDDISLTVTSGYDIGLSKITYLPVNAKRKDTLSLTVTAKNYGALKAENFSIKFFYDGNFNNVAENHEQFKINSGFALNARDSLISTIAYLPLKAGEHRFIAVADFADDENKNNDTIRTLINIGNLKGDILVNEIMYAPVGDEPEWVELYNNSPDTINLKNWKISDSNVSTKTLISASDYFVAPNSYQVIAKDANFALLHPDIIFIISNFSALNNTTSDAVVIYDRLTNTIDSLMYAPSWGGQNGKSLERIDFYESGTIASNWKTSLDLSGRTPGKINSTARLEYDLALTGLTHAMEILNNKKIPLLNLTIKNIGRQNCDSMTINFFADNNLNSIGEQNELIDSVLIAQRIIPGDSLNISKTLAQLNSGETTVLALVNWRRDERLRNNSISISVRVEYETGLIIINEFMCEPLSGQNEWIELYNRSNQSIDLYNWTFNDKATSSGVNSFRISSQSFILNAGAYLVIAADSSIFTLFPSLANSSNQLIILNRTGGFSLNNDGDAIILKDLTGNRVDSVCYTSLWHHINVIDTKGRSLERINPDINSNDSRNWSTCTEISGGTPGRPNSILTSASGKKTKLSISPNPFSPDGDGHEDFCIIEYNLPMMTSTLNIKIFDIKGRLIKTISNCELAGYNGKIIWDGFGNDRQRARIGVYVVFMEATDRSSGRTETAKSVVVVATKL